MKLIKWGMAVFGLIVVLGAVTYAALDGRGSATAQVPPDPNNPGVAGAGARYEELLAQNLGVSVETLKAAQKSARDQLIDEAVAEGRLTAEQGEKLKSLELGEGRKHLLHRARQDIRRAVMNFLDAAAETIGISRDDLKEELRAGKSLTEIAGANNVSPEALKSGITSKLQAKLQEAVARGHLTQAEADQIASKLDQRIEKLIQHSGVPRRIR
jgi:hypothetical protein